MLITGKAIGEAISDEITVMADRPNRVPISLKRDPVLGAWKLLGATSVFLASRKIGDDWRWIRAGGFGAAIALGVAGLSDLLGVEQKEQP
jgi:hypothetical protein